MWNLLVTDLLARLRGTTGLLAMVVSGGAGLLLLEAPVAMVANTAISALLFMPLLINGLAGATDAREHRIHFQKLLPLRSFELGFVRVAVPLLVQLTGILAAALLAFVAVARNELGVGIFWRIAWMGLALLVSLQWFVLQRELVAWRRWSGLAAFAGGVGAIAVSGVVFFIVFAVVSSCRPFVPLSATLAAAVAMLLTVVAQAAVALGVFVRRDAIAA